jgi:F-box domain
MLASLALEILFLILDHLPTNALLSLRATCKALLYIITPRVFSDFCFDLRRELFDINVFEASPQIEVADLRLGELRQLRHALAQLQYLRTLSDSSCTVAPHVIRLHIASLYIYTPTFTDPDDPPNLGADDIQTVLLRYLPLSISKLQNLETVR